MAQNERGLHDDLTEAQAVELFNSGFWEKLSPREIAEFQFYTARLCMPFDVFHGALEKTLVRPVWTHEIAMNRDGIAEELRGEKGPPTFAEIAALIPEEKRIVLVIE